MLNTCKSNVVFGELGRRKKNLRQRRQKAFFYRERVEGASAGDSVTAGSPDPT